MQVKSLYKKNPPMRKTLSHSIVELPSKNFHSYPIKFQFTTKTAFKLPITNLLKGKEVKQKEQIRLF